MTSIKRRIFLKGSLAAGAVGAAVGAGLLTPRAVLAAWPSDAFSAKDVPDALTALLGTGATEPSTEISIKAPDIAENAAVVPITVETNMPGVERIAIVADGNPFPLTSAYDLGPTALPYVSTRIRMAKTSDVIAVVKADGKLYSARKSVKVTIGGCGG
jgi:sulfur-oxidizing protein SoxY